MNARRQFLSAAAVGTAALAASPLLAQAAGPGSVLPTRGQVSARTLATNAAGQAGRYRPHTRLGLGGVAIGNGFAATTDAISEATLAAAYAAGVRFFDTSPWYGLGITERDVTNSMVASLAGSSQTAPTFWLNPANSPPSKIGRAHV